MLSYIATIKTSNAATGEALEILHWLVNDQPSIERAQAQVTTQAVNANRTIPAVANELVSVEPFQRNICIWLAREQDCQGHSLRLVPLKQERGGNEGRQF